MKIITVVGARPNFMKLAPLLKELKKYPEVEHILVHTGQHYDYNMNEVFFRQLQLPKPNYNLEVGSGNHGEQTGRIMIKFEKILIEEMPNLVMVIGDVNSTIACALVAKKNHIKVAHIESGARDINRETPEEINRLLTDQISDFLFTLTKSDKENLLKENIPSEKIFFVGDYMIDCLLLVKNEIDNTPMTNNYCLNKNNYVIATIHRPHNVDNKETLTDIVNAFIEIQNEIPILLALHPRTKKNLIGFNLMKKIENYKNIIITEPLDYITFMKLIKDSKFIITDSGGIQSEATYFQKPLITLSESTGKPITVECGINILVGNKKERITNAVNKIILSSKIKSYLPEKWDGDASKRTIEILAKKLFF